MSSIGLSLAKTPTLLQFDSRKDEQAGNKLRQVLQQHKSFTLLRTLSDPSSVLLNDKGLVGGEYSLSTTALGQLSTLLARGLSYVVSSVAGTACYGSDATDKKTDPALAISILNGLINLRFNRLEGCKMIVDRKTKQVEGIVGRRYEYFSNYEMFDRVDRYFCGNRKTPATFADATLYGRRLLVRYRSQSPIFTLQTDKGDDPFYGGYQFENAEVGTCALKGTTVIIRHWCDNKAVAPFSDNNKVSHIRGKVFQRRFSQMLERIKIKDEESKKFRDNVTAMLAQPLKLGMNRTAHDARYLVLEELLRKKGLSRPFAQAILNRALISGSYRADKLTATRLIMSVYASRTLYDLFNAITFEAKGRPIDERMQAELLAYQMLNGKWSL